MKIFNGCLTPILLFLFGCNQVKEFAAPELVDSPRVAAVRSMNLPETAPGHGIATYGGGGVFEVNIESDDTAKVKVGQPALVFSTPGSQPIASRVIRILQGVSSETGQSLAWLKADRESPIAQGEFIFATITIGQRPRVLALPLRAVLVRDGKSWVIVQAPGAPGTKVFRPVEVKVGVSTESMVEIVSGLNGSEQVVTDAGLGFLYPDFKSQAEGD